MQNKLNTQKRDTQIDPELTAVRDQARKLGVKNLDHFDSFKTQSGHVSRKQRRVITALIRIFKGKPSPREEGKIGARRNARMVAKKAKDYAFLTSIGIQTKTSK